MKTGIVIAVIAAFPPTLAAVLGFLASSKTIRRSVGAPPGVPLARLVERLEGKVDHLAEGQAQIRERLARLEAGAPASPARTRGGKMHG